MAKKLKLAKITVLLFVLLFNYSLLAQENSLPDFSSSANKALTKRAEKELGKLIFLNLKNNLSIIKDEYSNEYLNLIGKYLVSFTESPINDFNFFLVENSTPNAFALPGGYIGVHTGLLLRAENESELASVLAHEIAHVTQRHIARMYEQAQMFSVPTIAAAIGSMIIATQNPAAGSGALAATLAGSKQLAIHFTREHEQEADRIGLQILKKSGFDPKGMANFFSQMQKYSQFNKSNIPDFLQTHPIPENRITEARLLFENPNIKYFSTGKFELIKERIKILYDNLPQTDLNNFENLDKNNQNRAEIYGQSLVLLKTKQLAKAKKLATDLIKQSPNEFLFKALMANIEQDSGNLENALIIMQEQYLLFPESNALAMQYAETLIANKKYIKAIQLLEKLTTKQEDTSTSWQLIREAAGKSKQNWLVYFAQAEYLASLGNYEDSIKNIKTALTYLKEDKYQQAKVKAKLNEFIKAHKDY